MSIDDELGWVALAVGEQTHCEKHGDWWDFKACPKCPPAASAPPPAPEPLASPTPEALKPLPSEHPDFLGPATHCRQVESVGWYRDDEEPEENWKVRALTAEAELRALRSKR